MKESLCYKLWARILAAVLLAAATVGVFAGAVGIILCVNYNIYNSSGNFFASDLCRQSAMAMVYPLSDAYDAGGAEEAQRSLDYLAGATNVYLRLIDDETGETIAESEVPDAVLAAGLEDKTNYYGTDGYAETFSFSVQAADEIWESSSAAYLHSSGAEKTYTIAAVVAAPLAKSDFDNFYRNWRFFDFLARMRYGFIVICAVCALLALACLLFLFCAAGHRAGHPEIVLSPIDRVPLDLLAALLAAVLAIPFASFGASFTSESALLTLFLGCLLAPLLLISFAARCKAGGVFKNTVIYRLLRLCWRVLCALGRGCRAACRALPLIWKFALALLAAGFLELVLFYQMHYGSFFAAILFVLFNLFLLAAFCYGVVQLQRLKKAGEALAAGDFETKVDTRHMYWEFRKHGESLNAIGSGMSIAVEQKMKSERMKTELITNVSHDIKTPLTSVINYADLLQRPGLSEEERSEYLAVLSRQSQRLKKLIEDLVEASKASTGNIAVSLIPTDLGELLHQSCAEYAERLQASKLEAVLNLGEEPLSVLADGRLLWRVLDNLLGNACKYAMPGTRVYLNAKRAEGGVLLSIKNISRAPLNVSADELMERFVRGDSARSSEGSGLGLSIARSLTELQGGTFTIAVDGDLFKAELLLRIPG